MTAQEVAVLDYGSQYSQLIVRRVRELGFVSIHFYIATGLGVAFAMMLMGALMGLVFLSSGSGHDERMPRASQDGEADS